MATKELLMGAMEPRFYARPDFVTGSKIWLVVDRCCYSPDGLDVVWVFPLDESEKEYRIAQRRAQAFAQVLNNTYNLQEIKPCQYEKNC